MIRFHLPTKIILLVLALMVLVATIFIIVEYPKLKPQEKAVQNKSGVCTPNLARCADNPKLCLDTVANVACN